MMRGDGFVSHESVWFVKVIFNDIGWGLWLQRKRRIYGCCKPMVGSNVKRERSDSQLSLYLCKVWSPTLVCCLSAKKAQRVFGCRFVVFLSPSLLPMCILIFFNENIGLLTKIAMCNTVFSVSISIFQDVNLYENKTSNQRSGVHCVHVAQGYCKMKPSHLKLGGRQVRLSLCEDS